MSEHKVVLDGDDMRRTLVRIAHEIVERHEGPDGLAVVGIQRRGAVLAERLHRLLCDLLDDEVPLGFVDISFYRDDLARRTEHAAGSRDARRLPDRRLDRRDRRRRPLHGRTVRAAIDALFDFGRPAKVQLAVLADRGHRELPIRPTTSARTSRPRAASA